MAATLVRDRNEDPTKSHHLCHCQSLECRKCHPFTTRVSIFAGPLYIQDYKHRLGLSDTHVITRAIHLELVRDMSAQTFICSFKRFAARRGLPALMVLDNGKAFEAVAKIIKNILDSPIVQNYFDGIGIVRKFNVPKAP